MKVLIVGSGGREHALAWVCSQSEMQPDVYCAPGNGGTERIADNIPIKAESIAELVSFVKTQQVDLVIIGPEAPLVEGLADKISALGIPVFGPHRAAAMIEGSKAFAKQLMLETGIPTASYKLFNCNTKANEYIRKVGAPIVIKAAGLAAGKGVFVCQTTEEALANSEAMLLRDAFGSSGREIVVEECLVGRELSLLALVDGEDFLLLPPSRDHKRAYDNDQGPNTGGMGAYSPLPDLSDKEIRSAAAMVFPPIIRQLNELDGEYRGCLYAGLIKTDDGFKVLEFNCRFGDPEAQTVIPILGIDLLELMTVVAEGSLGKWLHSHDHDPFDWQDISTGKHATTVVACATGYPDSYQKGSVVTDLPEDDDSHIIFHAGTIRNENLLLTSGGRVFGITGIADSHSKAVETAYEATKQVWFKGVRYRADIGRNI